MKNETEEETLIRVAGEVASKYFISGYQYDDLKNEFVILAMEILKKYDDSKGKLENFLRVALNNAAQNFVKSRTVDKKPCGCEIGLFCERCRYREGKARVLLTKQYPENVELSAKHNSVRESLNELLPLIDQKLPLSMRTDWRKILEGTHVVKSRKSEIFEEIREIVKEFEEGSPKDEVVYEYGWETYNNESFFFIESDEHLAKLYMDEEAANIWLHTLSAEGRQIYIRLRECGTLSYEDVLVLVDSINKLNCWDV